MPTSCEPCPGNNKAFIYLRVYSIIMGIAIIIYYSINQFLLKIKNKLTHIYLWHFTKTLLLLSKI